MRSILDQEMPQVGETLRYRPKQRPIIPEGELYEVEEVQLMEVQPYYPNGVWVVRVSQHGETVQFPQAPGSPFWLRLETFERP